MRPTRIAVSILVLLAAGPARAQEAQEGEARFEGEKSGTLPQLPMVERYVGVFNTGDPQRLAALLEKLYSLELLEDFGGAPAAAWDRMELLRTYGPVEVVYVEEEPDAPIVWTRGTVTGGWVGHQFYLGEGEQQRVVRHSIWRAWPRPYPDRSLPEEQVADSILGYLDRLEEAGLFSGSVTLSHRGRLVLARSFGSDAQTRPGPVTSDTRFHIASVTKLLTVTALLQLVESGDVGLDDPLSRWIPEYPRPYRDQVTVRHLLTHTSGIELDDDPAYLAKVRLARSAEELLAAQVEHIRARKPRFPPGSEYDYSSEGIDLLGVIIERVADRPWTEVVRDRVLEPSGMSRTRFTVPVEEGDWAVGFTSLNPDLDTTTPGALRPATQILPRVAKPSSGVWSTADDLHRFMRSLLDHRILSPAWTDSLLSPQRVTGEWERYGIRSWVGLGAQGEDLWGTRTVGHGGVVPGYSSVIEYLPKNGWLLTLVSNTGEATGYLVFQRFLQLVAHAR